MATRRKGCNECRPTQRSAVEDGAKCLVRHRVDASWFAASIRRGSVMDAIEDSRPDARHLDRSGAGPGRDPIAGVPEPIGLGHPCRRVVPDECGRLVEPRRVIADRLPLLRVHAEMLGAIGRGHDRRRGRRGPAERVPRMQTLKDRLGERRVSNQRGMEAIGEAVILHHAARAQAAEHRRAVDQDRRGMPRRDRSIGVLEVGQASHREPVAIAGDYVMPVRLLPMIRRLEQPGQPVVSLGEPGLAASNAR